MNQNKKNILCNAVGSCKDPLCTNESTSAKVLVKGVDESDLPTPFVGVCVGTADYTTVPVIPSLYTASRGSLHTANVLTINRTFCCGKWRYCRCYWCKECWQFVCNTK